MIQWLKTSDIRPNPADNPNIIVAVPIEANSLVKPYAEAKFSLILCAGGKRTKDVWKSLPAGSPSTDWFKHTEVIISVQEFSFWCDFDPAKIPWVDRSAQPILFSNPTESEEIAGKLFGAPFYYAAATLVMVPVEDRVTGGDELEAADSPLDLFVSEKSGRTMAVDIVYLSVPETGEGNYVATDWLSDPLELSVPYYYLIPPAE